jgi:hypothetical protein
MFSAMLFAIAIVALAQFAIYYWRAVLTGVASQPIPSRVLEAAHLAESDLRGADFEKLASLHELTPELRGERGGLGLVRTYYQLVRQADELFGRTFPTLVNWSEREQALCARYAAVQIARRLESNLAQAASMRSC